VISLHKIFLGVGNLTRKYNVNYVTRIESQENTMGKSAPYGDGITQFILNYLHLLLA